MSATGCDHGNESEDVLDTRAWEREKAREAALAEIRSEAAALRAERAALAAPSLPGEQPGGQER